MKTNTPIHTFHIPVMGLAYTIDSPIRVAHYGISSVISIIDDELIEKMHSFYSKKFHLNYEGISTKVHDYRAKRITAYLNMVDAMVKQKFEAFKQELIESKEALDHYIAMLPTQSELKKGYNTWLKKAWLLKTPLKRTLKTISHPEALM